MSHAHVLNALFFIVHAATLSLAGPSAPAFLFSLCSDNLTCNSYDIIPAFSIRGILQVDQGVPSSPSSGRTSTPGNSIPTYLLQVSDALDASSSLFFSIVAGLEYALQLTNTTTEQTMVVVQPSLMTPAIAACTHLNIRFVVLALRPLPGVVTANLETQNVAAAYTNPLCRGVIEYALGGMAYVVGAVSSEMSITGNIALITGPVREPYVTYHAYVREGFRSHCPACVLSGSYLGADAVTNATQLVQFIVSSGLIRTASIDVLLMAVADGVLDDVRMLLRTVYNVTNVTVLCLYCNDGVTQITFQALPMYLAVVGAFSLSAKDPPVNYSFSLESGIGVSVQTLCSTCISERALRTYADTTTALTTIYDTYGPNGTERLLKLPMWGNLDDTSFDGDRLIDLSASSSSATSTTPLWRPRMYRFSADPFQVAPAASFMTVAMATSCDIMEQLQLSGVAGMVECIALVISARLSRIMILLGGVTEWVAPQVNVAQVADLTLWLQQSADHVLPDCCFSVDAIDQTRFLVFGGEHATTLLPQTLNDMFMITLPDVGLPAVTIERVVPSASSSVPASRADHAHTTYVGSDGTRKVFIHGGRGDGGAILQDLWCYNAVDKAWTQLASSATTRYLHKLLYSKRLGGDDVLVAWGGENLVPLQTMEQYSIQRNSWFSSTALPVRSTMCVASVGPMHVAFLEASKLSPCIMDVVSMTHQCTTGNVASLLSLTTTLANTQLLCGAIKSAENPLERVGLLVVPDTAVSSTSVSLVVIPQTTCPPPYVLQVSNASTALATPSPQSIASPSSDSGTSPLMSEYTPAQYQALCTVNCPSQTFPFLAVCWPCSTTINRNLLSLAAMATSMVQLSSPSWTWTNLSVATTSADYLLYAAAADAALQSACAVKSAAGKVENRAQDAFIIAATASVVILASASLGYLFWLIQSKSLADKELSYAPIAPPVTFVLVDVHGSSALWKADPTFHAKYLDTLSLVTSEAIQHCRLYRVRRVGDAGYLIACPSVPSAVCFVQALRQRLFVRVLEEVKSAPDSAMRYARDVASRKQKTSLGISRRSLASLIVDATKFAVHTTSCITIRRTRNHNLSRDAHHHHHNDGGLESVEYDGEDVFITPSAATHCTNRGEISFTLDAVAELSKFHKESVADGEHLRVGRRDTEYASVTIAQILSLLGAPSTGGGLVGTGGDLTTSNSLISTTGGPGGEQQHSAVASPHQSSNGDQFPPASTPSPTLAIHRACLNGTHIRVLKLKVLEPPVSSTLDELGATSDPPRPGGGNMSSGNDDAQLCLPGFGSLNHDDLMSRGNGAGELPSQSGIVLSGDATAADDTFNNDAITLQLDTLYDYLDIGTAHPAVLSRDDFSAMRQLIGFVLCSAINSLEDDQTQEQVISELTKAFALSECVRRSGAEEVLLNSPEGRKLVFFEHLAARVLQGLEPLRVKRYLAHCTAAGKAAAALGVGDFSSTAAAATQ